MHVRCPHCQNPVEFVDEVSLRDITCPSCGSNFSLANDVTVTDRSATKRVGHFELLEQVGLGGFGAVFRAKDIELDRIVAVKLPRKDQLTVDEQEQFLREARAVAQLRHPHIVSVYEVGRDGESIYIVSDFVQGATLAEWLESQRLTTREAVELMTTVCEAVQHAHDKGVIHRDLKPGNILLDLEGQPHITDFGLAKRESGEITMTVDGRILGTPAYMSPEQASGKGHDADRRSDVYSLGVVLFQLLTGELPFRGNPRMLVVQVLKDEAPSPRKLNNAITRDLETITLKCLEKEPSRRFQTAQAVADELRRVLRQEPIQSRPIGRLERGRRWCKRQPMVAGLIAAAVSTLAVGTMVSAYFAWNESTQRRAADQLAGEKTRLATEKSQLASQLSISLGAQKKATSRARLNSAKVMTEQGWSRLQAGDAGGAILTLAQSLAALEEDADGESLVSQDTRSGRVERGHSVAPRGHRFDVATGQSPPHT